MGTPMKPQDLRIINSNINELQKLGCAEDTVIDSMVRQILTMQEIVESEPPILYYDDEGQPINGIASNAYHDPDFFSSDDEPF